MFGHPFQTAPRYAGVRDTNYEACIISKMEYRVKFIAQSVKL